MVRIYLIKAPDKKSVEYIEDSISNGCRLLIHNIENLEIKSIELGPGDRYDVFIREKKIKKKNSKNDEHSTKI